MSLEKVPVEALDGAVRPSLADAVQNEARRLDASGEEDGAVVELYEIVLILEGVHYPAVIPARAGSRRPPQDGADRYRSRRETFDGRATGLRGPLWHAETLRGSKPRTRRSRAAPAMFLRRSWLCRFRGAASSGFPHAIDTVIACQRLTQAAAAERLVINQPKVSGLANYKLDGFSVERLMTVLTALDEDIGSSSGTSRSSVRLPGYRSSAV